MKVLVHSGMVVAGHMHVQSPLHHVHVGSRASGSNNPLTLSTRFFRGVVDSIVLHETLDPIVLHDQDELETIGKILGRVEILDLEAFHRVSLLIELQAERILCRRR